MIRLGKPVQVLEWGKGTNTTNQNWNEIAKGRLFGKPKTKLGNHNYCHRNRRLPCRRKNDGANEFVKVMQQGEGMTPLTPSAGVK